MSVDTQKYISAFDLFTVGVGPSSSHTVGPMRAAVHFSERLADLPDLAVVDVKVDLYGSLAATGDGHGTLSAVKLGLEGIRPETALPADMDRRLERIQRTGTITLASGTVIPATSNFITMHPFTTLERHTNAVRFSAFDANEHVLLTDLYFSVGGGFIEREGASDVGGGGDDMRVPYPYQSGHDLLALCATTGKAIWQVAAENEEAMMGVEEVRSKLLEIVRVMQESAETGLQRMGELPGGLRVARRAAAFHSSLQSQDPDRRPEHWQDWINVIALAVNEENASGGRVVTAPTNGASGIIPAVLDHALTYIPGLREANAQVRDEACVRFLLTAAAVGSLFKMNASISGAEVGCQGEVGSASSMAAAGLAELLGGSPEQVENAAEIAMEHSLGLTCDPIGGLVQIPCIERNAIAASKAVNAAHLALRGNGIHHVSLDAVILTLRRTGEDMNSKYKETSRGGLAITVNVPNC